MLAFYGWLRGHPVLVDSALALVVASLGAGVHGNRHLLLTLLLVISLAAPITVRRKYPVGAFLVVVATGGLQVAAGLSNAEVAGRLFVYG